MPLKAFTKPSSGFEQKPLKAFIRLVLWKVFSPIFIIILGKSWETLGGFLGEIGGKLRGKALEDAMLH